MAFRAGALFDDTATCPGVRVTDQEAIAHGGMFAAVTWSLYSSADEFENANILRSSHTSMIGDAGMPGIRQGPRHG